MAPLPTPILSKLAHELAAIRADAASLEALISAGAAHLGPTGVIEAQKLDHILQSLDSLTGLLTGLSEGTSFEHAVANVPLAHMAQRLNDLPGSGTSVPQHPSTKLADPELF